SPLNIYTRLLRDTILQKNGISVIRSKSIAAEESSSIPSCVDQIWQITHSFPFQIIIHIIGEAGRGTRLNLELRWVSIQDQKQVIELAKKLLRYKRIGYE